ncbi:hypothetical protein [Erwinia sp. S38]|uniref:hypothetical protein n=1 Tax=Erwinia sp. S38 TaxID=2769338 RepID=UPI00190A4BFA|nr:hypothetical protein [Erwinia sp. S38]MBK0004269.1 hypothetical protein [Erwinia sp. S38]
MMDFSADSQAILIKNIRSIILTDLYNHLVCSVLLWPERSDAKFYAAAAVMRLFSYVIRQIRVPEEITERNGFPMPSGGDQTLKRPEQSSPEEELMDSGLPALLNLKGN